MESVGQHGGGVAVGEVEKEERDALLKSCYALRGEQELDCAGVARSGVGGC